VVRALCVSPLRFREGLGTQMMHFVMETASRMRCRAVRFDVWSGNVPAVKLCEKLGFRCAGRKSVVRFGVGADERAYYEWAPAGGAGNETGRASPESSQGHA
ncbi:MAG: GNAT family N-acetyltransferase, partial [Pyramidobacter sp.]|nr:GNAT family N-acetyltransferase [Pyramidobacter sp.]